MIDWIARLVLAVAAVITGWFVAEDAPYHHIFQMAIGVFLIALFVLLAAVGPSIVRAMRRPEA